MPRDLVLVTNIFRWVRFQAETITAVLRDFELPLLEVRDLRVWGPALLAEEEPMDQERYLQTLPSSFSDGPWRVWRSLKSIKLYSNLNLSSQNFSACLGPCLDPVLGQVTIAMTYLLGRRPKDPSPPLPWWDKVRYFTHGRLSIHLRSCTFRFLTTMDPYNIGERVELCCHRYNITLDQLEEIGVDCYDLDLFIRTTSQYEDCKPLHVPRLNLRISLFWQTAFRTTPGDHFSVRLSERKSNGKSDSYADFRYEIVIFF